MKKIEVSDEMYNFLMELSNELNTQNHRATAMPYFFQIQTKEEVPAADGCGIEAWYQDGSKIEDDDEIKEVVFEYKDWDLDCEDDCIIFGELYDYEIEEIMVQAGWRKINYDTENVYKNAFLTEKACREHIAANNYHYCEPVDYLSHSFRNPELEMVMKFLCELTKGKLHK